MTDAYSYTFDAISRIEDDPCHITQRNLQNVQYGTYTTTNYFAQECGMKQPIAFATSQPNVFASGGYMGAGGCNVDQDTRLRYGSVQTNPKSRVNNFHRPFATVPFLGRGSVRPVTEAQLQQGDFVQNKKSCDTTTEMSHIQYRHTPMVNSLRKSIQNPSNLVEGAAAEGWIRGGVPTRELIRDQDYMDAKKHG